MTNEPSTLFSLIEDELTIVKQKESIYSPTIQFDLKKLEDAKRLVTLLNNNVDHQRDLSKHHRERSNKLKERIETYREASNRKSEAIATIQSVYELRSKETDFNTQIIALIKLDCIKEIRKQYELIKLREQGGKV